MESISSLSTREHVLSHRTVVAVIVLPTLRPQRLSWIVRGRGMDANSSCTNTQTLLTDTQNRPCRSSLTQKNIVSLPLISYYISISFTHSLRPSGGEPQVWWPGRHYYERRIELHLKDLYIGDIHQLTIRDRTIDGMSYLSIVLSSYANDKDP